MIQFIQQVFALARPYRGRLVLGILFGVLAGVANSALMLAVKLVLDVVFPDPGGSLLPVQLQRAPHFIQEWATGLSNLLPQSRPSAGMVVLAVSTIPLVMLVRGVCAYLNNYFLQWVGVRATADLRNRLFAHLNSLSLGFFHRTSTGELMSRINSDTGAIQNAMSNNLVVLAKEPITIVGLVALLFSQQPRLTLLALLILPLCMVPVLVYARRLRKSSAAIQEHAAELSQVMHETFTGNRIIKAYNLEAAVQQQFENASARVVHHLMRVVRSMELPGPMIEFGGAFSVSLIFLYVALDTHSTMKSSDLFQFVGCIFLLYQPVKALTRLYHSLVQSRAASARVFELLATQPTVEEPARPVPLRAAGADIQFDRVDFAYAEKPVLQDIQMTIKAGQLVALVGASGSGKTSLTNLLLRFFDPNQGAVRIGGMDIREVALRDLRGQIAVVTQESILFNDTVRNNIALGRPGASEAEIISAARNAHAHEFIMEKPQGYDTVIGEKGVTLSGGQKQRLAIARAILKNAPILVLDEATSSLDTESERAVQAALDDLMQHRTTLCIAHRLSTVQHADTIVVLDQGRIVESGTHTELLAKQGVYHKLHQFQFSP